MSVTIRDIAKASGVSIGTVSRVLHKRTNVAPDTSRRVRETIDRLGYDPISNIPLARIHTVRRIGLVLPDGGIGAADFFYSRAVFSLRKSAQDHGFDMAIFGEKDVAGRLNGASGAAPLGVDGLIYFCPANTQEAFYGKIRDRGISCTIIRRHVRTRGIIRLSDSDYSGGRKVGTHLFGLGHRRIMLLDNGSTVVRERMNGLRDVFRENGCPVPDEALVPALWPDRTEVMTGEWLARFDDPAVRPTAVFAYHDTQAITLINRLRERGISVPDDVSVAGYDDTDTARLFYPPLTTVRIPVEAMVRTAASLMTGGGPEKDLDQAEMTFENELIVRQSTAACRE